MGSIFKDQRSSAIFLQTKGSISIFLSIVVFALSFLTFYSVRHITERKGIENRYMSIDIAVRSLLADYDSDIYKNYGLTVLGYSSAHKLKNEFNRLLFKNDFADVENTTIEFVDSITGEDILKEMITEHMDSRVISKIVEEVIEKFSILESFSKFKDFLETKTLIESIIFDCEKICAYIVSDLEDLNIFDIEKALLEDTEYLIYKLGEFRRFGSSIKELIGSIEKLCQEKDKLLRENDIFSEILDRVNVFTDNLDKIKSVVTVIDRNISIIITCIEMIDLEQDIKEMIKGYSKIDIDVSIFIPKIKLESGIKDLDLREIKGGFFDELLLNIDREDILIDENLEVFLPFIKNERLFLSNLKSLKSFFSDISFSNIFERFYE